MHEEAQNGAEAGVGTAPALFPEGGAALVVPKVWSVLSCFLLLLGYLGVQLVVGLILGVGFVLGGAKLTSPWFVPSAMVLSQGGTLLLLWLTRGRQGAKRLWDSRELRDARAWGLVAVGFVVSLGVNLFRVAIEQDIPMPTVNQAMIDAMAGAGSIPWAILLAFFIGMVILAPLAEEWLFRGILQTALGARWGPLAAVPVTAALFALFHDVSTWWVVAIYGLVWGWIIYRRSSLTVSILTHAAWNLTAFFMVVSAIFGS